MSRNFIAILIVVSHAAVAASAEPLGSPKWTPTPEQPVGWRGDGTGRYPAATPLTEWSRTKSNGSYTAKGIVWMTQLPNIGVSNPVIVGDKMLLTAEPTDLVCLDKNTGKLLWIRSNSEFEGLSQQERDENAAFKDKLSPLAEKLLKANDAVVAELNKHTGAPITSAFSVSKVQTDKRNIEKSIVTEQQVVDKKKFERHWAQAVFGFAGQTPTSDGKYVAAFFTTGVTACYDLNGNRKWIHKGRGAGSEHGNFASPVLVGGKVVVWANELRGYDVESGKLEWTHPAGGHNTYGSLFRVQSGDDKVACFQNGYFVRVRDGKMIWDSQLFGDSIMTPIVEGGTIYAYVGYPKNTKDDVAFRAFKIPATTDAPKIAQTLVFKTEWAADEIPEVKDKSPYDRNYAGSALYVDGLIYRMTAGGGLIVNDAKDGSIVYRKVLAMKPRASYWTWAGASTSPTLGGKHIYLMDNQGVTIVIEPGREYKEVARNMLEESLDGKGQSQNLATPIFEGSRMYYRTPGYLYCIGEK